jgi:hypothetical protein
MMVMSLGKRMVNGGVGFGLGNFLAGIIFGLGRMAYAQTQYGIPDPQPWGMMLLFGLLPYLLAGGVGGYLVSQGTENRVRVQLAVTGGVAGGLAYIGLSAAFWSQIGLEIRGDVIRVLPYLQAVGLGLFTGVGFGVALKSMRIALPGGISGAFGFGMGFLIERILLVGLSILSASTGYHFPAVGLQHPWYWVTWIFPYALYGAIGGAILGASINLRPFIRPRQVAQEQSRAV